MTESKIIAREVFFIVFISIILGLFNNYFSNKGIPLFRKETTKVAVHDSLLFPETHRDRNLNADSIPDSEIPKDIKVIAPLHEQALRNQDSLAKLNMLKTETALNIITLSQLNRFAHERRGILFDARTDEDYKKGHIKGALNIFGLEPEHHVERFITLPRDTIVIIYCNNPDCHLGVILADFLKVMGFNNLYLYDEGWDGWVQAKMPIDTSMMRE